ncbi:MAG: enoyl-CoA hydratase/isomerase family protein [Sphingomonadaceae bacterium]|nr:enoyl-CoA hydratase/isomerase family protein [Sphingomonadaceae bacterium]
MSEQESALLIDRPEEGVERITLNRPDKFNAFNAEMYDGLLAHLERIRFDPSVRVVILTGNGRGFCGGNDLSGMGELKNTPKGVGQAHYSRYTLIDLGRIPLAMKSLPQPVICAVNGAAAGIGYSLALASDLAIAGQSAKFVNAIHNAGTGAELGMSYLLPRAVGTQRAAEILYTMRPVLAEEAERIGLVLRTVPDDQLSEEALKLARNIIANVPIGIWLTKQALWMNQDAGSLEQAMEFEHRGVFIAQSTEDAKEKRKSFIEKRHPTYHHR